MRLYTIKSGDTLSQIAEREMGGASRWMELWRINAAVLRAAQRPCARRDTMTGPDWIFPGTVIAIPE